MVVLGRADDEGVGPPKQFRQVVGPLQGFGQLWQKTLRVQLDGSSMSPQEVVAAWKERFATFWPKGARFHAPLHAVDSQRSEEARPGVTFGPGR